MDVTSCFKSLPRFPQKMDSYLECQPLCPLTLLCYIAHHSNADQLERHVCAEVPRLGVAVPGLQSWTEHQHAPPLPDCGHNVTSSLKFLPPGFLCHGGQPSFPYSSCQVFYHSEEHCDQSDDPASARCSLCLLLTHTRQHPHSWWAERRQTWHLWEQRQERLLPA